MAKTLIRVTARTLRNEEHTVFLEDSVDFCPVCHQVQRPAPCIHRIRTEGIKRLWITYQCQNIDCQTLFIAEFEDVFDPNGKPSTQFYRWKTVFPSPQKEKTFPKEIGKLSPVFVEVFNQALKAEDDGLDQICGPGYRKALEFLIKDFCISKDDANKDKIQRKFLGNCIKEHINNERIKQCAERAVWLGNDETHYIRNWSGKDVRDLKTLIQLTVNFIENEVVAESYLSEMPNVK